MTIEPVSSIDEAWLHMEAPTNQMTVSGFFTFERPLDLDQVKATITERLLSHGRFRQRVVENRVPLKHPRWSTVDPLDIDAHVTRSSLPEPGDEAALRQALDAIVSGQIDFDRPLWQIHLLEGYGDGCALVFRVHHSIGDGMALLYVLLSMCDPEEGRSDLAAKPLVRGSLGGSWLGRVGRAVSFVPRFTASIVYLLFRRKDPQTAFRGVLGTAKRTAWSAPIELARVKAIAKSFGCKINDVLLSATAGALRRYLVARGEPVDGLDVTAVVPVNLRPLSEAGRLGNRFGLVIPRLPVGVADPVSRLDLTKRRMNALKRSTQAVAIYSLLRVLGLLGKRIEGFFIRFLTGKATGVMTNVPGPRGRLVFAGEPIERIMFWVPQSGHLGLGVSIFSYAGEVSLGIITDDGLVADPVTIGEAIHDELDALEGAASR